MPARLPLPKLSFRWQITLLGAVVVVLFIAVLIATLGALQYTKSAVLNSERRRLLDVANDLARNFMDAAKSASQARGSSFVDFNLMSSPQATSEISRGALQRVDGIGGGFYQSDGDLLIGSPAAANNGSGPLPVPNPADDAMRPAILDTARVAANTHAPTSKAFTGSNIVVLIEAVPIGNDKFNWGSAWTVERLQSIPGSNRFRAYLITVALGVAALVCVILTLLVVRNLQAGVIKIEKSLQDLEWDLTSQIPTGSDPEEIERIAQAINRLGASLRDNITREKQIEDQLRHSERLAALGRLVAGVAHEVRNPLATIRLRVQMAQREARNSRVNESCEIALEEIERLNGMVNRLLNFARPVRFQPEPTNLKQLTEQRLNRFLENAQKNGHQFRYQLFRGWNLDSDRPEQDGAGFRQRHSECDRSHDRIGRNSVGERNVPVKSVSGTDKVRVEFRDSGNGISSAHDQQNL